MGKGKGDLEFQNMKFCSSKRVETSRSIGSIPAATTLIDADSRGIYIGIR